MRLELLARKPEGPRRGVSVLLLHGICAGAWIWEGNVLPYLAAEGFPAYALSLRGHGESPGREDIRRWNLSDFAADVADAVALIGGPVVLVGHSMGGGVAQHFLARGGKAAGLVLMASAPPHGLMRASMAMYASNPMLWGELSRLRTHSLREIDFDVVARGMFSRDLTEAEREHFLTRMCEPALGASLDLMGWRPIAPPPWGVPPTLVIGGARDEFIPPVDVQLTGVYYGLRPVILPGCAHAVMIEPAWEDAARLLRDWLAVTFETRGGAGASSSTGAGSG